MIDQDSLGLELSQKFKLINYELGETLYPPVNEELEDETNDYLYWIYQGKVRIIGFDSLKQRQVSAGVLTSGETFGWEYKNIFYQIFASSPCQIIAIPSNELKLLFKKYPELEEQLLEQKKEQLYLIFLKTLTELRSKPSQQLQQILPLFQEIKIPAHSLLKEVTPHKKGRFWLLRGEIENKNGSTPLIIGSAWGYPEETPPLQAKTNLLIYHLPIEEWQNVKSIIASFDLTFENSQKTNSAIIPSQPPLVTPEKVTNKPIKNQEIVTYDVKQESFPIDFPKPLKHNRWFWQNYPFIQQQSSTDCGATCLAMISKYWGKRLSINFLRNLLGIGRSGSSLKNLAHGAESLGYLASPVRASFNRIAEQENPWIAHWGGNHYVVVYKTTSKDILIADPAQGKLKLTRQQFLNSWTGYAVILNPTEKFKEVKNEKPSLGKFVKTLFPYKKLGIQIIIVSIIIQLLGLVSPLFTQIILDQVIINKSQLTLNVFIIGALICGIWQISLSGVRQYLLSYLSNRLNLTMISGFIKHALSLPLKFFELRTVGDIITRVQENQKIQQFLIKQVLLAWLNFVTGFVYLGLMLYYNWQLTLLILGLIPPIVIVTLISTPFLRQISKEIFNASATQNSSLVEMINGLATIKSAAAENDVRWRWEEHLTEQLNKQFKGSKLGIALEFSSGLINSVGSLAILWFGATLVINDQLSIGQLIAFNMMKGYVLTPVISLVNLWDELQQVLISIEKLNDVLDNEPEETPSKPMLNLPPLQGEISFEKVSFRYNINDKYNTLENITFKVLPGKTIALVGRSGSGKSTLIKLLEGLYKPLQGKILLDGHDISHISPQSLRTQLGVVPQECFLFSGTILENITLYRPEYSLEEVIKVAKLAEAHSFIQSMPLGYNTQVGEKGSNLSGGQRQRIAIARALLGEPRILILDEATSSLDTESERRFQQNLTLLGQDRTIVIIAHRLATVRNADHIIVLDRGVIIEQGNHQELIENEGTYYYLAQQQLDL